MCCARWVPLVLVLMRTAVSLATPSTLPGNAECNSRSCCGVLWRTHVWSESLYVCIWTATRHAAQQAATRQEVESQLCIERCM
jgi:hypothetical protein